MPTLATPLAGALAAAALLTAGDTLAAEDAAGLHCQPRRHHLMVMAGPGVTDAGAAFATSGLGYEYRLPVLSELLGVGAMVELMFTPTVHPMLMATLSVHPFEGLSLLAAVGATHVHESASQMATQPVVRLSAGYDFHLGTVMLTPYVNADLSDRPRLAVSMGLCAGLMF